MHCPVAASTEAVESVFELFRDDPALAAIVTYRETRGLEDVNLQAVRDVPRAPNFPHSPEGLPRLPISISLRLMVIIRVE